MSSIGPVIQKLNSQSNIPFGYVVSLKLYSFVFPNDVASFRSNPLFNLNKLFVHKNNFH